MQESLYQIAGARDSISNSACKRLYQTADAKDSISDSGCRRLYKTANGVDCRHQVQESLQMTAVAGVSI